jgi:outer membrane protein assembly factor BamD (BamD/ComL family)
MRFFKSILMVLLAGFCLAGIGCRSSSPEVYVVEEQGRGTLRSAFDRNRTASAEQWAYARETQDKGRLKKAERRMLYLVRRWPNSQEAPWAARARADMLYARGQWKDAFKAYQFLVDNYSSRMHDYDSVLESQFEISVKIMNRRHMRWLFGGYRAPEYAVDYFEDVIRNGPQWSRAPEAQFLIGQCHENAEELELAISAYGVLGYRYPSSTFAEEAAWRQINALDTLRKEFPNNLETLDRTLTATTVFLSAYPSSPRQGEIVRLRNVLYEVKAGRSFDEASFYAEVLKQPTAAILCYKSMMNEYPKSRLVPQAQAKVAELQRLMALPAQASGPLKPRSRPLFGKDASHAEG